MADGSDRAELGANKEHLEAAGEELEAAGEGLGGAGEDELWVGVAIHDGGGDNLFSLR